MRIIQVAHALHPTDAASRQLLRMDEILRGLGYETAMYAHRLDERLADRVEMMGNFSSNPQDIVIYHMTTGTSFNRWVWNYPRKVVLFHNRDRAISRPSGEAAGLPHLSDAARGPPE